MLNCTCQAQAATNLQEEKQGINRRERNRERKKSLFVDAQVFRQMFAARIARRYIPHVPTPESAAAFEKLANARARLNDLSRELREAIETRHGVAGDQHYRELQEQWEEAFKAFQSATDEFAAIVHEIPHEPTSN